MESTDIYYNIHYICVGLAFVISFYNRKKLGHANILPTLLGLTLIVVVLPEQLTDYDYRKYLYASQSCIELVIWSIFFYRILDSRWINFFQISVSIFLLYYIFESYIVFEKSYLKVILFFQLKSILLATLGSIVMIFKMNKATEENLLADPIFIISIAVTWFSLTQFFRTVFFDYYSMGGRSFTGADHRLNYFIPSFAFYLLLSIAVCLFPHRNSQKN